MRLASLFFLAVLAVLAVLAAAVPCCSTPGSKPPDVVVDDAGSDQEGAEVETCKAFKLVGQPCDDPCECLGGLCLLNEYAPFRFCSRPCGSAGAGTPCEPEKPGGTWNALCVDFPSDFLVPPDRFCAPLCATKLDCAKLAAPWEECAHPSWKGNPLYSAIPDKVCISPSAQGHEPVDPDTCEGWEELYNTYAEERLACIGYCEFLAACQFLPASTPAACCAFHCMTRMVKGTDVDKAWFKDVRCYFDHFQAFSGTALACTKPLDTCGAEPVVP